MKPPFHLDASALLAHFLNEPGYEIVEDALEHHGGDVHVSAVAWLEFRLRLKQLRQEAAERVEALAAYRDLLGTPVTITGKTADEAFELREHASSRLPGSDALIAAASRLADATLIHRDPHFLAIPKSLLRQIMLPDKPHHSKQS